ncbi:MAG: TonB-dependent receptor, partial [Myxococcota bacterium]
GEPATPAPETRVSTKKVTGSRIARGVLESYAPLRVVTHQQLVNSGATTLEEFLFRLPSVSQQGVTRFNTETGEGNAFVELRNLGVRRTLVLVNGRRFVGPSGLFDFNVVPISLVDRVEILLEGASAVYGSEAVGGVINVITKDEFTGVEANVFTGIAGQGDGEQFLASLTVGDHGERGRFVLNAQYLNRLEIAQPDREWAANPIVGFNGPDFENDAVIGSGAPPEGRLVYLGDESGVRGAPVGDVLFRPNPTTGESFQPFIGNGVRYNNGNERWLSGRLETFNVTALGGYDVNESVNVFVEGFFNQRRSRQRLAPQPLGPLIVDTGNPLIPNDYLQALAAAGAGIDPITGLDASGQARSLGLVRTMTDIGNRFLAQDVSTFRLLTGLRGETDRWDYELYLGGGQSQATNQVRNAVNQTRAQELADPTAVANGCNGRGCTELGDYFGQDTLSLDSQDYLRFTQRDTNTYAQFILGGSAAGALAELPAGDLGIALGFIYRDERGEARVDTNSANGEAAGAPAQSAIGGFDTFEVFAEASIPLLARMTGVHDLSVDLAGRFSDFSTFGSEFTYKAGLTYAPIDWVRLRGSFATAFRAPAVSELFGAAGSRLVVDDPCDGLDVSDGVSATEQNCLDDGVVDGLSQAASGSNAVSTQVAGNAELDAETSTFLSVGGVLTPLQLEDQGLGITLSADYYDYDVENVITAVPAQSLLDRCYRQGIESACQAVSRNASTGAVQVLNTSLSNDGALRARGLEFTVDLNFDLERMLELSGTRIDLGYQHHTLLEVTRENTDLDDGAEELEGTIAPGSATYARTRWTGFATLSVDGFRFANVLRFIGGADAVGGAAEELPSEARSVDSVFYWDASVSYLFGESGVLGTVGLDNVLDQDPPYSLDPGQNANPNTYDFVGRYFYLRATYRY